MTDHEIYEFLNSKAPLIEWKIMGNYIEGKTLINGRPYAYALPKVWDKNKLEDIAEGFMLDFERKKNA